MQCPFCPPALNEAHVILENMHCLFLQQTDPVLVGSGLIIPRQHRKTVFDLTEEEWQATFDLLRRAKAWIDQRHAPDGYDVGWNCGHVGGQEVFHAHLHVIPRFKDEPLAGKGIRYWLKQDRNRRSGAATPPDEIEAMKVLTIVPIQPEIDFLLEACTEKGLHTRNSMIGRLPVVHLPKLDVTVASGGLGKVQFAVQTRHLLDVCPGWDLVICAGAAGALVAGPSVGDVVVATETVEHDIHNKFGKPLLPKFRGAETIVSALRSVAPLCKPFQVHFGPIASGDEDVVDADRRRMLHRRTGALAVAWEGAGGARACHFSGVPFVEIRGITDSADSDAASDFEGNLGSAMTNVATLITSWLDKRAAPTLFPEEAGNAASSLDSRERGSG